MSEDPAKYGTAPEDPRVGRPPLEPATPVGERFEELRAAAGMSLPEWTAALGIGHSTYHLLRRGEPAKNIRALEALAEKFAACAQGEGHDWRPSASRGRGEHAADPEHIERCTRCGAARQRGEGGPVRHSSPRSEGG